MKTVALSVLALLLSTSAVAQEGPRDPMQPPPAMLPATAPGTSGTAELTPVVARHLMVIDGVRWVIEGGRRRGVGDLLGSARIERIEDSAIVVRQGRQLQRLPLFVGVVKKPVPEPLAAATAAPLSSPARAADAATRTALAPEACANRPSCMQRPSEP